MKKTNSSKNYVLNHKYGYGEKREKTRLNKLYLRNFADLDVYLDDVAINAFNATYKNKVIQFNTDKSKYKIVVEKV